MKKNSLVVRIVLAFMMVAVLFVPMMGSAAPATIKIGTIYPLT